MRLSHYALIGVMMLPACTKKDSEDVPPMPAPPPVVSTVQPEQPTVLSTAEPAGPGEVVRPELDGREDGIAGTLVAVSGARANLKIASDWKVAKAEYQVATAPDGKSVLALGASDTPTSVLDKMATAAGLSGCTWGAPQSLTVGKDKLATQAADGTCKKGAATTPAAYMATEGLVAVGAWDEGSDRTNLFGAMRSVAKAGTGAGGVSRLVACCRVLAQNGKNMPPPQGPFMIQAAATCEAAARANNVAAVNAALSQFGMKCN